MTEIKFDPKKLAKLNDPERLKFQDPNLFWPLLALKNPKLMVEVGCGTGFYSAELLKLAPNAKLIGLDISEELLSWARENRPEVSQGRLDLRLMPESQIPLESQIADLVVMVMLHHELHQPLAILAECKRILKPAGKLLILDWAPVDSPMGPPAHIRVSAQTMADQMAQAGFENVKTPKLYDWFGVAMGQSPSA
ncbi:MAG: hypothetical protein A2527_07975 [Candidatus Lambdaproteobacteria bacterium RIFOXYD2_FULL_50_16]|uniref:Methyltransferase type 11 domain-containing protein n=1 Tax=Candidatus Lambdaproteobacteria bacterium RIFOXYD2_FULL_50_16 TaxID=1817772 RepID=A0A1F6GAI1_9PROT|nr:MAG: hypothetical protein A2527_07975 [Candidatus Lambdaproteobacteria bacterium RIFOXYD2_FULL_50_16]